MSRPLLSVSFASMFLAAAFTAAGSSPAFAAETPRALTLAEIFRSGTYVIPSEWAGVWDSDLVDYECGTSNIINTESYADTLCTGQSIDPNDEGVPFEINCTGTIGPNAVDVECTGSDIVLGCTVTITYSIDGTRTNDTSFITQEYSLDYEPNGIQCGFQPDDCVRTEITATRIAPEPPNCLTPVDANTWGQVKARYR